MRLKSENSGLIACVITVEIAQLMSSAYRYISTSRRVGNSHLMTMPSPAPEYI